jgi:hypothetical protein
MDAPRTGNRRSLLAGAIVALAFAVALTMLLGAASADAHSRTKRPDPRKQAAAHQKKHKVAVTHKKGRNSWSSPGGPSSYSSIGERQATTGGAPSNSSAEPTTPTAKPTATTTTTTPETAPVSPATIPPVAPEPPAQSLPTPELPTPGGLLFNGAKASDYSIEAAPHAVSEVPDPAGSGQSVFDLTVQNQDVAPITPTENPRAQMLSPGIINNGSEFWLQTKFYIPVGMPYVSEWLSLVSIYGPPFEGSSPWQISINEGELRWMRNGDHNWDVPWKASLAAAEGQWTTVLLHEKFATDGFVEMWINGQQINFFAPGASRNSSHEAQTTRLEMATMDSSNNGGANAAKIMQYRAVNMFQSASIYFQPLVVGTSRSAVEY